MDRWEDSLQDYLRGIAGDLLYDWVNAEKPTKIELKTAEVETVDYDTDDGCAFGTFKITINGGEVVMIVEASGYYSGEQDCWSWSSESHYTKTVHFEELEDITHKLVSLTVGGENVVDKAIDAGVNSSHDSNA